MHLKPFTCLFALALGLILNLTSYGQNGSDPAVMAGKLAPAPLAGVGSPFSMTFTIGNNGYTPISGQFPVDRMGFGIALDFCAAPLGLGSVSGDILTYFDITYVTFPGGTFGFEAQQKEGVVIPAHTLVDMVISAVVTRASPNNDFVGAGCVVVPNAFSSTNPTGNDHFNLFTHTTSAMPVSLVWFKAEPQPGKRVALSWQTSLESGNKGYLIERSKDLKNFEPVGAITDVAANSTALQTYHLIDPAPYRGTSYYRLKQLDLSGATHLHAAVAVNVDGVYGVYPNPVMANTEITLSLDEPGGAKVNFYNPAGQAIGLAKSVSEENRMALKPVETLTPGVYVLQVEERGQVRTHRVVVQ